MKRFKLNFAVAAFLLGSVIAITQSSFTPAKKGTKVFTGTIYDFTGTKLSQADNASFYSAEVTPPTCNEDDVIPCRILIPPGQSLSSWLSSEGSPDQVLTDAMDTKD